MYGTTFSLADAKTFVAQRKDELIKEYDGSYLAIGGNGVLRADRDKSTLVKDFTGNGVVIGTIDEILGVQKQ